MYKGKHRIKGKKKKIIFVTTLALGLSPRQKACKGVGQK